MDLRQLEHFVAVAEEKHFTRASERLFISQSGLSASIRALEKELDAELFDRNTRRVALTDAGLALLEESRRTLASVVAARDAVAAVQGLRRGRLRVGTEQCLVLSMCQRSWRTSTLNIRASSSSSSRPVRPAWSTTSTR